VIFFFRFFLYIEKGMSYWVSATRALRIPCCFVDCLTFFPCCTWDFCISFYSFTVPQAFGLYLWGPFWTKFIVSEGIITIRLF
jgi:hypothetical protein